MSDNFAAVGRVIKAYKALEDAVKKYDPASPVGAVLAGPLKECKESREELMRIVMELVKEQVFGRIFGEKK